MKKNFQGYALAHSVAFYVYIVEVGSLLLWKFGLGSYSRFEIHWLWRRDLLFSESKHRACRIV